MADAASNVMSPLTSKISKIDVNNNMSIHEMPTEVLENIAGHLVPRPEQHVRNVPADYTPHDHVEEFAAWKETLYSFRLTCKAFGSLETPKKYLFATLYW